MMPPTSWLESITGFSGEVRARAVAGCPAHASTGAARQGVANAWDVVHREVTLAPDLARPREVQGCAVRGRSRRPPDDRPERSHERESSIRPLGGQQPAIYDEVGCAVAGAEVGDRATRRPIIRS